MSFYLARRACFCKRKFYNQWLHVEEYQAPAHSSDFLGSIVTNYDNNKSNDGASTVVDAGNQVNELREPTHAEPQGYIREQFSYALKRDLKFS